MANDLCLYETGHQMGPYPKAIIWAILSVLPTVGILLIVCAFIASFSIITIDGYPISVAFFLFTVMVGIGLSFLLLGWQFITVGMARYRFSKEGIYAKYPLQHERLYHWTDFQEVCVCYSAYTTRGPRKANTIICCVKYGERKNLYGRWRAENPFRYRSIVSIEYSLALYCGIKEMCPYDVVDLRGTQAYKLF